MRLYQIILVILFMALVYHCSSSGNVICKGYDLYYPNIDTSSMITDK